MASVYVCNVIGDGLSTLTAFAPSIPAGKAFACLMIDTTVKKKALIVSSDDTITGIGISKLLTAATYAALVALAKGSNPSAAQIINISGWLTSAGYAALTVAQVTWWDTVQYAARQVNPAADLALTMSA